MAAAEQSPTLGAATSTSPSSPKALDLFSGIGGMALGVHAAFPGLKLWKMCEADADCREVLGRHFPGVPCETDVMAMQGDPTAGVALVYGGFPCQDVSCAGRRAGVEHGSRSSLFTQMIRLACECRAPFILMENVAALRHNGLSIVCDHLTRSGFVEIRWVLLSADSVGMRHRRDRIFIAARNPSFGDAPGLRISTEPIDRLLPLRPEPSGPRVQMRPVSKIDRATWKRRLQMLGNTCVPRQGLVAIRALFGMQTDGVPRFDDASGLRCSSEDAARPGPRSSWTPRDACTAKELGWHSASLPASAAWVASASTYGYKRVIKHDRACLARTLLASDSVHMLGRRHDRQQDGSYSHMSLLRWVRHNPQPGTWGISSVTVDEPPIDDVISVRWAEWFMGFEALWLGP